MQLALNTQTPFLLLDSDSMCISDGGNCNGWSHPFDETLHFGDLLIIQGVNPTDLNSNYPQQRHYCFQRPSERQFYCSPHYIRTYSQQH